jgi:hypothetical protein
MAMTLISTRDTASELLPGETCLVGQILGLPGKLLAPGTPMCGLLRVGHHNMPLSTALAGVDKLHILERQLQERLDLVL